MRNKYKLESHKRNYIMHELYDYTKNKKKLLDLQEEILSSSNSNDGQPRGNQTGDPTGQKAISLMTSRSILIVQEKINNIERALERLTDEERDVVDIIFNKKCSQAVAETKYNISYDTYYNTKRKIIYLTAIEYGEI